MTDQPDWITKVNKAACFARHHVLEQLRKIILEKQEWELSYLKERYKGAWVVMTRCPGGSGYAICEDILQAIDDIEGKDAAIFGPITIHVNVMAKSLNEPSIREALQDGIMKCIEQERNEKMMEKEINKLDLDETS